MLKFPDIMKKNWLAIIIGLLAGLCLYIQLTSYISIDNGWLLYATDRWLDGEVLYRDILETNPPLIVWLYAIPTWIAWSLSLPVGFMFPLSVWLLMLGCLALSAAQM